MLFETEEFTLTTPGAQTLSLAHVPKDKSEHVHWHPDGGGGIFMGDEEWTREANVITVPDPDGELKPGDVISVKYAREA